MKKIIIILSGLLILAGCSKSRPQEENKYYLESFQAEIDGDYTKAVADMNTGKVSWQDGDLVKVSNGTEAVDFKYDKASGKFIAQDNLKRADHYYAYYPAINWDSYDDGIITAILPEEYEWKENMVETAPMSAINDGSGKFTFKNLCSIICLNLTGEGTVSKVEFTPKAGAVAGYATISDNHLSVNDNGSKKMTINSSATLSSGNTAFYIIVPARKYEGGFSVKITYSDGSYVTKDTNKDIALAASQIDMEEAFEAAWFSGGKGTQKNPYKISSPEDLILMSQMCNATSGEFAAMNFRESYYQQTADLDFSGLADFQTIGKTDEGCLFTGSYDGGGFIIKNINIVNPRAEKAVGLFGYVNGEGTISNIKLENFTIETESEQCTGGIVGRLLSGTIKGCSTNGNISNKSDNTGGITGWMSTGTKIEKCTCSSTVKGQGKSYVGGIAGRQDGGSVIDCCADNAAISGYQYVGGIVGYISAESNVSGCHTKGGSTINGTYSEVGGIVGYAKQGHISDCHFDNGTVTGATNHQIGGIGGTVTGSGAMVNNCTSSGKINAEGGNVGGICGATSESTVRGCILKDGAEVTSASSINVGGIIGFINDKGATIEYCNVGQCLIKCHSNNYAAGIVGRIYNGNIKGCKAENTTVQSGMTTGGIVGLITAKSGKSVTISGCSTKNCHILSTNKLAGGVVGNFDSCASKVIISECIVEGGDVTTDTAGNAGGIVSGIGNNNKDVIIIDKCTASCDVTNNAGTSTSGNVGGILGWTNDDKGTIVIANCIYYGGSLINKGSGSGVGGIVGSAGYSQDSGQTNNSIVNCASFPKLLSNTTNNGNVAGIVGYTTYNKVTNCWSPVENGAVLVNNATSNNSRGSIYGWQKWGAINTNCYYRSDFKAGAESSSFTYTELLQGISNDQMKNNGPVTIPSSGKVCNDFLSALNEGAQLYNAGSPVGAVLASNWVMGTNGYPVIEGCPLQGGSSASTKVKVGLIGDSISTFKGGISSYPSNGQYPSQDVNSVEQTYWYQLIYEKMTNAVLDVNTSYTGTTVQNTLNKGHMGLSFLNRYTDLVNPDIIFINGGTNDGYSFKLPLGTLDFSIETNDLDTYQFAQAYDKLIRLIGIRYPSAKIFPIIAPCMAANTKNGDFSAYGKIVKDICEHYGLHYAELIWDYNTYAPADGVHPNAAGHTKMAEEIFRQIKDYL